MKFAALLLLVCAIVAPGKFVLSELLFLQSQNVDY